MKKSMLRLEIKALKDHISYLERARTFYEAALEKQRDKVSLLEQKVRDLHRETEQMYHTPEFAADTKSAVDRGRQEGVRSMSQRAQNDMLAMLNDMYVEMEKIAHKYTRDLTYDVFTDNLEEPQNAKSLPDTEFAEDMVKAAYSMVDK